MEGFLRSHVSLYGKTNYIVHNIIFESRLITMGDLFGFQIESQCNMVGFAVDGHVLYTDEM